LLGFVRGANSGGPGGPRAESGWGAPPQPRGGPRWLIRALGGGFFATTQPNWDPPIL